MAEEAKSEQVSEATEEGSEKKLSEDAFQNFIQGKRHMLVQDYASAVTSLADACQLYVERFGETAIECGEVYFHYGKALFRLFQQQAGIIGNLMSDESSTDEEQKESESEEDKDKESGENTDATSNDGNEEENENDNDNDEEDLDDEDEASSKECPDSTTADEPPKRPAALPQSAENEAESTSAAEPPPSGSSDSKPTVDGGNKENDETKGAGDNDLEKAGPSKPKEEDEVTDLQLAWETLETAKSIFTKQGDKDHDGQLKVAEILLILAEISMEMENYNAAVNDLQECLSIRKMYLKSDDRLIAETFYQLGLVYNLSSQVSLALENFQKSMDCIKLRIENLKTETGMLKTPEGYDLLPAEEIKELEAILPDIKAKMEDTQDMVQDTKNLLMSELQMTNREEVKPQSSMADKPVTNITHLLKRKKPEDDALASSSENKKVKLASNGQDQPQPESSVSTISTEGPSSS